MPEDMGGEEFSRTKKLNLKNVSLRNFKKNIGRILDFPPMPR